MTESSENNDITADNLPSEPEDEVQSLRQEIDTLKKELKEKNDKYLMALAESENSRKRMQKERQELMQYAVENAIVDFLNPMESMEKALGFAQNMSEEVKNWAIGFEMILNQFKQVLEEKGIIEYSSVGQQFDPFLHEAVEMEETDAYPEGTIIEELSKGYKINDRPIRVARVKVAKALSSTKD